MPPFGPTTVRNSVQNSRDAPHFGAKNSRLPVPPCGRRDAPHFMNVVLYYIGVHDFATLNCSTEHNPFAHSALRNEHPYSRVRWEGSLLFIIYYLLIRVEGRRYRGCALAKETENNAFGLSLPSF